MSESRANLNLTDLPEDNSIVETMGEKTLGKLVQTCRFFREHAIVNDKLKKLKEITALEKLSIEQLCVAGMANPDIAFLILKVPSLRAKILTPAEDPELSSRMGEWNDLTPPPIDSYLYRLAAAHKEVAEYVFQDEFLSQCLLGGEVMRLEQGLSNPVKRMRI